MRILLEELSTGREAIVETRKVRIADKRLAVSDVMPYAGCGT